MSPAIKNIVPATLEGFILEVRRYREQYDALPAAVKMRALTASWLTKDFPVISEPQATQSIYGVAILEDNTIPFGEYELVP